MSCRHGGVFWVHVVALSSQQVDARLSATGLLTKPGLQHGAGRLFTGGPGEGLVVTTMMMMLVVVVMEGAVQVVGIWQGVQIILRRRESTRVAIRDGIASRRIYGEKKKICTLADDMLTGIWMEGVSHRC